MAATIPSRELTIQNKQQFRVHVVEAAFSRAVSRGLGNSMDGVTYRDLGPGDLGLTDWSTPKTSTQTFEHWISYAVPTKTIICIYKVLQLSSAPTVAALRIGTGYSVLGLHELEACYSGLPIMEALAGTLMSKENKEVLDRLAGRENDVQVSPDFGSPMEAYFSEPYVFDSDSKINIDIKARKSGNGDYLVLGGYVFEPRGLTVV